MKIILGLLLVALLPYQVFSQSVSSFQAELNNIHVEISRDFMDQYNCSDLADRAYQLRSDVEDALEDENYTRREVSQLREIRNESRASFDFIRSVGDCNKGIVSVQDFYTVNQSIRSTLKNINEGTYCVDVMSVAISDFISYLAVNNSNNNYTVSYSWNSTSTFNRGSGTMGLSSKSMRVIYTNRDNPDDRDIEVQNINCQVF